MSIHGTRELNGFSRVVNMKSQYKQVQKKVIWSNEQIQKLIRLVQSIELTSQRTDWELVSQQVGVSSKRCREKYYQITKKEFGPGVTECFIELTKKALRAGSAELDWRALEEFFNKPPAWLQAKYTELAPQYFTEQDIEALKTFVATSSQKIKWKQCQRELGFLHSVCYQVFTRLYKEQLPAFTEEVEGKLSKVQKDENQDIQRISDETGVETCFLKFWLLQDKKG